MTSEELNNEVNNQVFSVVYHATVVNISGFMCMSKDRPLKANATWYSVRTVISVDIEDIRRAASAKLKQYKLSK